MGKVKYSVEEKLAWVTRILSNEITPTQAAQMSGINDMTIIDWLHLYEVEDIQGLAHQSHNRSYSLKLKRMAVEEYLEGGISLRQICKKYKIRNKTQLRDWIKRYNNGKDFGRKMSGGSRMKKTRKGMDKHKIYLSAILDLYDRRIAAFAIRDSNDTKLVYDTFDKAVQENPEAHPIFRSDRGYQYTSRVFHQKLVKAGMIQSMSRVAKCIDNGPMEGFWGILKRERYYGKRFTSREALIQMITDYIEYYNHKRLQRNLGVLTPMEKHKLYLAA